MLPLTELNEKWPKIFKVVAPGNNFVCLALDFYLYPHLEVQTQLHELALQWVVGVGLLVQLAQLVLQCVVALLVQLQLAVHHHLLKYVTIIQLCIVLTSNAKCSKFRNIRIRKQKRHGHHAKGNNQITELQGKCQKE